MVRSTIRRTSTDLSIRIFRRAHILWMIRQRTSPIVGVMMTGVDIVIIDVDVSEEDTRLQKPSLGRLRE